MLGVKVWLGFIFERLRGIYNVIQTQTKGDCVNDHGHIQIHVSNVCVYDKMHVGGET